MRPEAALGRIRSLLSPPPSLLCLPVDMGSAIQGCVHSHQKKQQLTPVLLCASQDSMLHDCLYFDDFLIPWRSTFISTLLLSQILKALTRTKVFPYSKQRFRTKSPNSSSPPLPVHLAGVLPCQCFQPQRAAGCFIRFPLHEALLTPDCPWFFYSRQTFLLEHCSSKLLWAGTSTCPLWSC